MHIRSYRSYFLATLAVTLMSSVGWAQDQSQDQGREFHWRGKLAAENVVIIKNVNGNIDAEPATGDEVEVTAEKSGPRANEVKIEVSQLPDGIMICAIIPAGSLTTATTGMSPAHTTTIPRCTLRCGCPRTFVSTGKM